MRLQKREEKAGRVWKEEEGQKTSLSEAWLQEKAKSFPQSYPKQLSGPEASVQTSPSPEIASLEKDQRRASGEEGRERRPREHQAPGEVRTEKESVIGCPLRASIK